jgi:hypothetical protein
MQSRPDRFLHPPWKRPFKLLVYHGSKSRVNGGSGFRAHAGLESINQIQATLAALHIGGGDTLDDDIAAPKAIWERSRQPVVWNALTILPDALTSHALVFSGRRYVIFNGERCKPPANHGHSCAITKERNMHSVTVYGFLINDQGKQIQVPSKRTIKDIEQLGGIVVAGSAVRVDESELREDGRYLPKCTEPGAGAEAAEKGV